VSLHKTRLPMLPLVDGKQRTVEYVRISLTDRCNYRCSYCMPEEGVELVPKADVLSFEEIERLVRALMQVGVRRVRLTGGEPTVRKDLVELVARLGRLGLDDLAMTTNGERLVELAAPLHQAGLSRLNVSVDTLDPERFLRITRRGRLGVVLDGIDAALRAGFVGTKVNVVALAGFNDDELPSLCGWAWEHDLTPRFIEFMPMGDGALFSAGDFLSAAAIRTRLTEAFGVLTPARSGLPGVGPARYEVVASGRWAGRQLGIISAVTEPFCDVCNRIRVSATGRLHTCLGIDAADQSDLRGPLRAGASDEELTSRVRALLADKTAGHGFTSCGTGGPQKHMVVIGG